MSFSLHNISGSAVRAPVENASPWLVVHAGDGTKYDTRRLPDEPGVAVEGEIRAPTGGGPSMSATCSVRLRSEGRFLVAQVLVRIPPRLHGVHVVQPYETLSTPKHPRSYETIAWELVVTKRSAVTVAGYTHEATRAGKTMAPEWFWSGAGWGRPGAAKCGGEGFTNWPALDLISVCP